MWKICFKISIWGEKVNSHLAMQAAQTRKSGLEKWKVTPLFCVSLPSVTHNKSVLHRFDMKKDTILWSTWGATPGGDNSGHWHHGHQDPCCLQPQPQSHETQHYSPQSVVTTAPGVSHHPAHHEAPASCSVTASIWILGWHTLVGCHAALQNLAGNSNRAQNQSLAGHDLLLDGGF